MASMENKGESIASWYQKNNRYTMEMIFRVIQETLFAVREVHLAGYLHLDLQEGNIFVTGQPTDESLTCFLLISAQPERDWRMDCVPLWVISRFSHQRAIGHRRLWKP